MDSVNGDSRQSQPLSVVSLSILAEGVSLLLSRWTALQMAVQNEWGGRDSLQKSNQLVSDVISWFSQSKDPHYIDDLENILDEAMVLSFNTEIEDGSIGEVAEQLMIMHEDCLVGSYESIEKLKQSNPVVNAVSQSKQVIDGSDDESLDEETNMVIDEFKPRLPVVEPNPKPNDVAMGELKTKELIEAEDGWSVVASRRNKGKRSG